MVDICFDDFMFEKCQSGHVDVAEIAETALTPLTRLTVDAAVFGRVAAAPAFTAALDSARTIAGRGLSTEADARNRQAQATGATGVLGAGMVAGTQQAAASATPAPGGR